MDEEGNKDEGRDRRCKYRDYRPLSVAGWVRLANQSAVELETCVYATGWGMAVSSGARWRDMIGPAYELAVCARGVEGRDWPVLPS